MTDLRRDLGRYRLEALIGEGRLVRVTRHVLVDRDRQLDLWTRAAAALLVAGRGALLNNYTAAALLGCEAADRGQVHVMVNYHRRLSRMRGVVVHNGSFDEREVVELSGLRVLALESTMAELLCRAPRRDAIACLDQAIALTPLDLRNEFCDEVRHRIVRRPDPRGCRRSQVLLDLATGLAESPAESWLLLALFDAGFPVPAQQVPVLDLSGRERYRLDFAWDEPRIAIEYDGHAAHADRVARDLARDEDLRRRGWTVIHANADDIRDPSRLHAAVWNAFWRRRFFAA
ncbi:endonuclease domain-containing protein [Actinophytocola sp. NPDC049390]|uniref:endonuclease domain-containing protein n=1 Tax=Actinophytocola sp. NPDC049390 TaxID=3363894 RepID=UPI00379FD571